MAPAHLPVFTMYVDECGEFLAEPTHGLRVVVGVLVAGDMATHDATLGLELDQIFAGWPGRRHATELRNADAIAAALVAAHRKGRPWPAAVAHLRGQIRDANTMRHHDPDGVRCLTSYRDAVFAAVHKLLASALASGRLVHTVEHNMSTASLRYLDMLAATLVGGLYEIARSDLLPPRAAATVEFVIEQRGELTDAALDAALGHAQAAADAIQARTSTQLTLKRRVVDKQNGGAGNVLVDFAARALGAPGATRTPLDHGAAERYNTAAIARKLSKIGHVSFATFGADETIEVLRGWLAGEVTRDLAATRLRSLRAAPRLGALAASAEHALKILQAWRPD